MTSYGHFTGKFENGATRCYNY